MAFVGFELGLRDRTIFFLFSLHHCHIVDRMRTEMHSSANRTEDISILFSASYME